MLLYCVYGRWPCACLRLALSSCAAWVGLVGMVSMSIIFLPCSAESRHNSELSVLWKKHAVRNDRHNITVVYVSAILAHCTSFWSEPYYKSLIALAPKKKKNNSVSVKTSRKWSFNEDFKIERDPGFEDTTGFAEKILSEYNIRPNMVFLNLA